MVGWFSTKLKISMKYNAQHFQLRIVMICIIQDQKVMYWLKTGFEFISWLNIWLRINSHFSLTWHYQIFLKSSTSCDAKISSIFNCSQNYYSCCLRDKHKIQTRLADNYKIPCSDHQTTDNLDTRLHKRLYTSKEW